jgi:hypothetical protein
VSKLYLICKECSVPVTKEMVLLEEYTSLCREDKKDYIPKGNYVYYQQVKKQGMFPYGASERSINSKQDYFLLNMDDLIHYKKHITMGCCGPDGSEMNICCQNDHKIGMEHADCWMPRFLRIPLNRVEKVIVD